MIGNFVNNDDDDDDVDGNDEEKKFWKKKKGSRDLQFYIYKTKKKTFENAM